MSSSENNNKKKLWGVNFTVGVKLKFSLIRVVKSLSRHLVINLQVLELIHLSGTPCSECLRDEDADIGKGKSYCERK